MSDNNNNSKYNVGDQESDMSTSGNSGEGFSVSHSSFQ